MKRRVEMRFITCPGSRIHMHYTPQFDGSHVVLIESGVSDIQSSIESHAKYTDLHYMLHRLSVGDTSVLASRPAMYGDFSGLPTNPLDAINIVNAAESAFIQLPLAERSAFNNDYRTWLAAVLSGSQSGKLAPTGASVSTEPVTPSEPVKE